MAISIYMEIESETAGKIPGSFTKQGIDGKCMECVELDHKVFMPIDSVSGEITGNRRHEPLVVVKVTDAATPELFRHVCTGTALKNVKLHFYEITTQGNEEEYYQVTLENAQVTSVNAQMRNTRDAAFERTPHHEEVAFAYKKITWKHLKDNIEQSDTYQDV